MNSEPWQCPTCRQKLESQFSECWNCGYVRGSGGDETLAGAPADTDPMTCFKCNVELDYVGTKKFYEGSRTAPLVLGAIGSLFVNREHFDVYVCPRCGRVELFVDGIGEEFREH